MKKFRIALARFRCSSHDLLIEKGRYNNTNREEGICRYCDKNVIEDEYHFLLVCPAYDTLRKQYIKDFYFVHPSTDKFSLLLNCSNEITIQNVAQFIHKAMFLRNCTE